MPLQYCDYCEEKTERKLIEGTRMEVCAKCYVGSAELVSNTSTTNKDRSQMIQVPFGKRGSNFTKPKKRRKK